MTWSNLRTTVPLVSYIRNYLRFWYYASLSICCQNLEKIGITRKIWEKSGVKLLRDLSEKIVNFSTLATSSVRLLLVFGEEDQLNETIVCLKFEAVRGGGIKLIKGFEFEQTNKRDPCVYCCSQNDSS